MIRGRSIPPDEDTPAANQSLVAGVRVDDLHRELATGGKSGERGERIVRCLGGLGVHRAVEVRRHTLTDPDRVSTPWVRGGWWPRFAAAGLSIPWRAFGGCEMGTADLAIGSRATANFDQRTEKF